jgi:hypothetical protein
MLLLSIALLSPFSSSIAGAEGAKKEWHDWVGPLDWCGFSCDTGEDCCTVLVVQ